MPRADIRALSPHPLVTSRPMRAAREMATGALQPQPPPPPVHACRVLSHPFVPCCPWRALALISTAHRRRTMMTRRPWQTRRPTRYVPDTGALWCSCGPSVCACALLSWKISFEARTPHALVSSWCARPVVLACAARRPRPESHPSLTNGHRWDGRACTLYS